METKFNSQVCTTKAQSERLLALGLKNETADMHWTKVKKASYPEYTWFLMPEPCTKNSDWEQIPAWSLHRLVEIGFHKGIGIVIANNAYDSIISLIEKRIKNGVFNKEYLNENI